MELKSNGDAPLDPGAFLCASLLAKSYKHGNKMKPQGCKMAAKWRSNAAKTEAIFASLCQKLYELFRVNRVVARVWHILVFSKRQWLEY